jgi:hypothetical protein
MEKTSIKQKLEMKELLLAITEHWNAEGNIFTQIDDRKRLKQFGVSGNEKQTLSEIKTKNQNLPLKPFLIIRLRV